MSDMDELIALRRMAELEAKAGGAAPASPANGNQPESQFWHSLAAKPANPNFPNVKSTGILLPVEDTYNPDGTLDNRRYTRDFRDSELARSTVNGIGDLLGQAETKSLETTPDAVSTMMTMGLGPRLAGEGKMAPKKFTPDQYQSAINASYETAKGSRPQYYNFMKESAGDQTIDVAPIMAPVEKVISEIETDPFHPARSVLTKLKNFRDTYGESKKMPLADAVEMKQDINSFFNPKKFDQGSKSPYFQVGSSLESQIDNAAKANPVFGKAKDLADENHVNNVVMPFTENKLLDPVWKPQDYYAAKSVEGGPANYLPDETRLRASQMVKNIKTPEQLDAVTRILPPEMAAQLRSDVFSAQKSGSIAYRVQELGNALGEPLKSPKHLFNAVKGRSYNDMQRALMKARKQPSPSLDQSFSGRLTELRGQPSTVPPNPEMMANTQTIKDYEDMMRAKRIAEVLAASRGGNP